MLNALYTSTLATVFLALAFGVAALLLVANELGKRANLPLMGRFALAGGLGFGVFALSIKSVIIIYLSTLDSGALAKKTPIQVPRLAATERTDKEPAENGVSDTPGVWKSWQALPSTAPAPRNNPQTAAKIALGEKLFFDTSLSLDRTISCASCHNLTEGGDDNAAVSRGVGGQLGTRNAPTVINAAFLSRLFWDGRAASLEAQAKQPLVNPVEMAMPSLDAVVARVNESPAYQRAFAQVFGNTQAVTIVSIARAIAAYERTLITPQSPYDRFIGGDDRAITPQQLRGMALFQANGCRNCHLDPTFSSAGTVKPFGTYRTFPVFPDNELVRKYDLLVDGKPSSWRVPSLRNVGVTAPYFYNGSVASLEEAIRVMAISQTDKILSDDPADDVAIFSTPIGSKAQDRSLTSVPNKALSSREIDDIAAFLRSLTGSLQKTEPSK